jgi:hypothetical protein
MKAVLMTCREFGGMSVTSEHQAPKGTLSKVNNSSWNVTPPVPSRTRPSVSVQELTSTTVRLVLFLSFLASVLITDVSSSIEKGDGSINWRKSEVRASYKQGERRMIGRQKGGYYQGCQLESF